MASREEKIQMLETQIMNDKASLGAGADCVRIARKQIELSRLYRSVGNTVKSDDALNDTLKTLEDPMCIQTNETTRLISAIKAFQSNPNLANMQRIPAFYRYLGLIVLFIGYAAIYAASYFINLSDNYFLAGIFIVFVFSLWIGSAARRSYVRSMMRSDTNTIEGNEEPRDKNL